MKKILLTLFAFAAIFVACDKENYEDQFETIAPEIEEIDATVANDVDFSSAFQFIQNLNNSNKILVGSPSADRGGDYGNNWLQAVFFDRSATDAGDLAYLRSDEQTEVCADNLVNAAEFFYHLPAADQLIIESGTGSQSFVVPSGSYDTTFQLNGPDALIVMNSARTAAAAGVAPAVADYDFSCSTATVYEYGTRIIGGAHDGRVIIPLDPLDMDAAINPSASSVGTGNLQLQLVRRVAGSGINTWENVGDPFTNPNYVVPAGPAVSSFYTVSCAPFPLTGVLATINSGATLPNGATSANYAGTTEAAVRQAIERDILDNTEYTSTTALTNPCN